MPTHEGCFASIVDACVGGKASEVFENSRDPGTLTDLLAEAGKSWHYAQTGSAYFP